MVISATIIGFRCRYVIASLFLSVIGLDVEYLDRAGAAALDHHIAVADIPALAQPVVDERGDARKIGRARARSSRLLQPI
jgi:hypothetical protein